MLQRQDRTVDDVQRLRTGQLQHMQMTVQQSDNISYVLQNQAAMSKKIDALIEDKNAKEAKMDLIMKALEKLLDRK
jgi:hypothetical protein